MTSLITLVGIILLRVVQIIQMYRLESIEQRRTERFNSLLLRAEGLLAQTITTLESSVRVGKLTLDKAAELREILDHLNTQLVEMSEISNTREEGE